MLQTGARQQTADRCVFFALLAATCPEACHGTLHWSLFLLLQLMFKNPSFMTPVFRFSFE
jgi:hypothetical protein